MWKARELREMAMKSINLEKVANSQDSTIILLKSSSLATHQFYWGQMADLTQKLENQEKATAHMESWGNSWRDQTELYIKRERKQRRQKNGLVVVVVGLIVLILIK